MGIRALGVVGVLGMAAVAGCGSSNGGPVGTGSGDGGRIADSTAEGAAAADAGGVEATTYFLAALHLTNGLCLPQVLPPDGAGLVPCQVFYVLATGDTCAAHPGLSQADPGMFASITVGTQVTIAPESVCVLAQLPTSAWVNGSCATSSQPGWCYVTGAAASPCAQTLAVSPSATVPMRASASLGCATPAPTGSFSGASVATPLGAACTPSPELSATFAGFDLHTLVLDEGNPACGADVCLVNHFQGRTTCPYGQDANGNGPAGQPACSVPGTNTPVQPAGQAPVDAGGLGDSVSAQCTTRLPRRSVYCSCRCENAEGKTDDGAAYCACPTGFSCAQLIPLVQRGDPRAGGYCIANGTEYAPISPCVPCDPALGDCP